jgi:hypothetical protein
MCIITATAVSTALGVTAAAAAKIALISNIAIGVGVASGVAGGVVGGVSSYQQGKAQQAQYNYQAKVNEENAKIAQENANVQRQQGIEEARLQRIKAASTIGAQKTAMAANGVDITQGTAVDVISDTAAMGELDALQTQYNYEMKARGYEAQAGNFQNQANLDVISGKNAYSAGKMNAINSGIQGLGQSANSAGQLAMKWFM